MEMKLELCTDPNLNMKTKLYTYPIEKGAKNRCGKGTDNDRLHSSPLADHDSS